MNILESILSDNKTVSTMASQLGITPDQAANGLKDLIPALSRGITKNTQQEGGLEALQRALETGNHGRYIERPEVLGQPEAIEDGNGILGHIFGTKDVSREVSQRAAQNSGLTAGIIKKMLPMAASILMGTLGRRMLGGAGGGAGGLLGNVLGGLLGGGGGRRASGMAGLLDFDGDGSIADDLLGIALKRFF